MAGSQSAVPLASGIEADSIGRAHRPIPFEGRPGLGRRTDSSSLQGIPFALLAGREVAEVEGLRLLLGRADDHRQPVPSGRTVLELLAGLDRVGIDLGADPGGPEPSGEADDVARVGPREVGKQDGDGRRRSLRPARFFEQGQEPVEADRGPHAGQDLVGEQSVRLSYRPPEATLPNFSQPSTVVS